MHKTLGHTTQDHDTLCMSSFTTLYAWICGLLLFIFTHFYAIQGSLWHHGLWPWPSFIALSNLAWFRFRLPIPWSKIHNHNGEKEMPEKKGKFQEFGISHLSILYYHHLYLVMTALLCRSWCFVPYMHIFCNKLYNRLWYMVSQVANIAYAGIICNEKYYNWLFFNVLVSE